MGLFVEKPCYSTFNNAGEWIVPDACSLQLQDVGGLALARPDSANNVKATGRSMELLVEYDSLLNRTDSHDNQSGVQACKKAYSMSASNPANQIADTSALVLLWCGAEIYDSSAVQRYAQMLDLSRGEELFAICNDIWPHYESVIRFRKICIQKEAKSILSQGDIRQVIIPGAGFSMLGVELVDLFPNIKVYELDAYQMQEKQAIVNNVFASTDRELCCMTVDVRETEECCKSLAAAGWDSHEPSLMIIEGLTYYLTKESVRRQWQHLPEKSKIIVEYLVPYEQVNGNRRAIPKLVFDAIMNYCSGDLEVSHWSEDELKREVGVQLDFCHSLSDIESWMAGERRFFTERHEGWIEIAGLTRCTP